MITKKEVLNALDLIEKYKEQQMQKIHQLEADADPRSVFLWG